MNVEFKDTCGVEIMMARVAKISKKKETVRR
jgi:hypothetical protein